MANPVRFGSVQFLTLPDCINGSVSKSGSDGSGSARSTTIQLLLKTAQMQKTMLEEKEPTRSGTRLFTPYILYECQHHESTPEGFRYTLRMPAGITALTMRKLHRYKSLSSQLESYPLSPTSWRPSPEVGRNPKTPLPPSRFRRGRIEALTASHPGDGSRRVVLPISRDGFTSAQH